MKPLVAAARAFSDPTRTRILLALRTGELCVCELSDALKVTQSTLSTHLQVIRASGLVETRREGRWSYYSLSDAGKPVVDALARLFAPSLSGDAALRGDTKRLRARLSLRSGGACCVGFACSPRTARTTSKGCR
ncbi:MAG: winged helix-turn-helix transcriptional regulator [Verrucomicrobiales bacterium]|nr:winged helix-turn-helix transcriptional regulator [Verrucomicrobiales bacterium]